MASLVNFSELCDYEEFRILEQEHIVLMLQSLQREHSPVYLFFSDDKPLATEIIDVDADNGDLVLAHTEALASIRHLNASGIFVVADHANTQIQYHVDALAQRLGGEGSGFLLPLPDSLYVIQRRTSLRREIPEQDKVVCKIAGVDYPVLDISETGLALLDSEASLGQEAGEVLGPALLSLPAGELSLSLTVANRFSIYVPEQNRKVFRIGCISEGLEQEAQAMLSAYLDGLASHP